MLKMYKKWKIKQFFFKKTLFLKKSKNEERKIWKVFSSNAAL
jgi:hypothetical protein